ncbi:MAG: hypothetical protein QW514_05025 [Thermoprotei archaeon]
MPKVIRVYPKKFGLESAATQSQPVRINVYECGETATHPRVSVRVPPTKPQPRFVEVWEGSTPMSGRTPDNPPTRKYGAGLQSGPATIPPPTIC